MLAVIDYRNPVNPWPPTWEFLEFISGLNVETCKARVRELEDLGYLNSHEQHERVDFEIEGFLKAVVKATEAADSGHPSPHRAGGAGVDDTESPF